jgi:Fe-S cluster assembly scaffold protein SufB
VNSYAKITINVTPYVNINRPRSFETITIYINKKQNDSNRSVNFIRDCTGEILESTSALKGAVYIQDPNHKNYEYIFIQFDAQTCCSIDYIYTREDCITRLVSLKQAVSLANRTITDWDSSEDNSDNYYTSSTLFSYSNNTSFRTNAYPRLIKNYGETSERNTLLSNSQSLVSNVRGIQYFDTTLKKPLFLTKGSGSWYWVDANGNNPDIPTKGTTDQRPTTNIAEGFEYYNTTVHKKQIYNGST